jgi:hypothetical protein
MKEDIIAYNPCHKKSDLPEQGSPFSMKWSEIPDDVKKTLIDNKEVINWIETTKKILELLDGFSETAMRVIVSDVKNYWLDRNRLLGRQ